MNSTQAPARRSWFERRQPLRKTVRAILLRTWLRSMIAVSDVLPPCLRLAETAVGPYKDRKALLRYLGDRPYISSRAQIQCSRLIVGARCFVDDDVTLYAHPHAQGSVHLAENVHLYRWTILELGAGTAGIRIGANTYLQSGCILNAFVNDIRIGSNCMIAARCTFMPYAHGHADLDRPMRDQPLTSRGAIIVEDDVWLGAHVCVLDGVTIGQGAIVGAGAVVTKTIPPYTIAVGVPARVVRERHAEAFGGDCPAGPDGSPVLAEVIC